jgi:hypothetical protein
MSIRRCRRDQEAIQWVGNTISQKKQVNDVFLRWNCVSFVFILEEHDKSLIQGVQFISWDASWCLYLIFAVSCSQFLFIRFIFFFENYNRAWNWFHNWCPMSHWPKHKVFGMPLGLDQSLTQSIKKCKSSPLSLFQWNLSRSSFFLLLIE